MQLRVYTVQSDYGSLLSSPPITSYGGSDIAFPTRTQSTVYEGSVKAFPPSTIPQDSFSVPRASAGIIARRYHQSEEITSQPEEKMEKEGGVGDAVKSYTPIPRKFEVSNDSEAEDNTMREVQWRDEEPYMTPTKKGKKRNKGKGVKRPVTPDQPIPNMPQTPSRRKFDSDWVKPAEEVANGKGLGNHEEFIGEYLRNTNGLRDFMLAKENYDNSYADWCRKQAEHVAARQNHTDAGVTSIRKKSERLLTEIELSREYDEEKSGKLDGRLEKMKKRLAKIAPVNMAKTIENALSGCMEKMIDQLTDRVVKRFEDAAEEDRKKREIRKGNQVECPLEDEMSDVVFEPEATFSIEENAKVDRAIQEEMEVEIQELEQSKHAPVIPPGGVRREFPRLEPGRVTISKKKPVVPAVPQQKKKEAKNRR